MGVGSKVFNDCQNPSFSTLATIFRSFNTEFIESNSFFYECDGNVISIHIWAIPGHHKFFLQELFLFNIIIFFQRVD
jgi:hypothetical protein